MNKVTPKQGQVWECIKPMMHFNIGDELNLGGGIGVVHTWLQEHFKFKPQSDLEWLAVNEPEWFHNDCSHIRRKQEAVMYTDCPERKLIAHHNWYARAEHQNMRFELGLDEKPKVTEQDIQDFADGIVKPLIHYKETKMIDLSEYKVNDKFDWIGNDLKGIAELVYISARGHYVFDCPADSEDTSAVIIVVDDKCHSVYDNFPHQFTKHDPRHWLSQLPDAGLFEFDWLAVECEESSIWHGYAKEPSRSNDGTFYNTNGMFSLVPIQGIKMPKLTGDEWKLSKISIVELRAWQVANKRAQGGPIKPGTAYIVGERGGPDVPVPAGPIVEANPQ